MTDETSAGPGAGSSAFPKTPPGNPGAQPNTAPEPTILEETVMKAAPVVESSPLPQGTPLAPVNLALEKESAPDPLLTPAPAEKSPPLPPEAGPIPVNPLPKIEPGSSSLIGSVAVTPIPVPPPQVSPKAPAPPTPQNTPPPPPPAPPEKDLPAFEIPQITSLDPVLKKDLRLGSLTGPTPPRPVPQEFPKMATPMPVQQEFKSPMEAPKSQPPVAPAPAQEKGPGGEIAKILAGVKIPERVVPSDAPAKKDVRVFDTMLGAAPETAAVAPTPAPQSTEPQAAAPEAALADEAVSPFRTLKNDLQEIVRTKKISLVRAAALESEKRRGFGDSRDVSAGASAHSRRMLGIFFAVMLLFGLGGAAIFGIYIIQSERSGTPPQEQATSILFAENSVPFPLGNLSPLDLKRLLAQAREGGGATLGSITRIVPAVASEATDGADTAEGRPATLEEFFGALGTRTPPDLVRALGSDFFFGLHTVDKNAPLLVVPVTSYERAFAGMLAWEQTMNADLTPVFTSVPDQVTGPGGLPQKRQFEDVVMRNFDVRALKDDSGTIQLYYSFPTRDILVLAESPYSFTEVLSRLRAERKL